MSYRKKTCPEVKTLSRTLSGHPCPRPCPSPCPGPCPGILVRDLVRDLVVGAVAYKASKSMTIEHPEREGVATSREGRSLVRALVRDLVRDLVRNLPRPLSWTRCLGQGFAYAKHCPNLVLPVRVSSKPC